MLGQIPDLIAKRSALTPGRTALRELDSGRNVTFGALNAASDLAARLFQSRGVGEGDRVAILCRNRIEFFEILFACAKIGAILVPLNWRMPAGELAAILDDCRPSLILVGGQDESTLAQ
jgi:fatty-acyl-CoA synthase